MPAIPFIVSAQYEFDSSSGAYGVVITPYGSNNVTRYQYTINGMAPWTTTMDSTIPIRIFPTFSPLYTYNVKVIAMNEYGSSGESSTVTLTAPGQPVISVTYSESFPGYVAGIYSGIYKINITGALNGSVVKNYVYSMDGGSYQIVGTTNPITVNISGPTYPSPHTFSVKTITALGTSTASDISVATPNGPTIPMIDVTYSGGSYIINVVATPTGFNNLYSYSMDEENVYTSTLPIIIPYTLDSISHTFKVTMSNVMNKITSNASAAIISTDIPVIVVTSTVLAIYTINVIWVPNGFVATNYAYSMDGESYVTVDATNPIIVPYTGLVDFHSFSVKAINAQGTSTPDSDLSPAIAIKRSSNGGGHTYNPSPEAPSRPQISVYYFKGAYKITVTSSTNINSPSITNYSYSMDGGAYISVSKTNPITVAYTANNTRHTFSVKAYNSLGWSNPSLTSPAILAPVSTTSGQT